MHASLPRDWHSAKCNEILKKTDQMIMTNTAALYED